MSLFKRLFSSDYRAAVAAEAAGDLQLAAERYALAGQPEAAVRVHLARARRADARAEEIKALRDALHWASEGSDDRRVVSAALGKALLARAREQGVATERDHERVREAAALLVEGGENAAAGEALESIGDDTAAARAFEKGGLVFEMEAALGREHERGERTRSLGDAFADYEVRLRGGDRDGAMASLRRCVEAAERKAEYTRLADDLESRLIAGGRVTLRRRTPGQASPRTAVLCAGAKIVLGRDALCDLPLRSGGISRMHTEIERGQDEHGATSFSLHDLQSRNGTLLGGLPIAGGVPLLGSGLFALGEDCSIDFAVAGAPAQLTLTVATGIDRGLCLRAGAEGDRLALDDLVDIPALLRFRDGRPRFDASEGVTVLLNGAAVAVGDIQLVRGDHLVLAGAEIEVQ